MYLVSVCSSGTLLSPTHGSSFRVSTDDTREIEHGQEELKAGVVGAMQFANSLLVVPPFEAIWLSGGFVFKEGTGCISFEVKGAQRSGRTGTRRSLSFPGYGEMSLLAGLVHTTTR